MASRHGNYKPNKCALTNARTYARTRDLAPHVVCTSGMHMPCRAGVRAAYIMSALYLLLVGARCLCMLWLRLMHRHALRMCMRRRIMGAKYNAMNCATAFAHDAVVWPRTGAFMGSLSATTVHWRTRCGCTQESYARRCCLRFSDGACLLCMTASSIWHQQQTAQYKRPGPLLPRCALAGTMPCTARARAAVVTC